MQAFSDDTTAPPYEKKLGEFAAIIQQVFLPNLVTLTEPRNTYIEQLWVTQNLDIQQRVVAIHIHQGIC